MTFVTHLATFDLTNYDTIGALQNTIVQTMARWKYIDDATAVYWSQNKLRTQHLNFEVYENEQNGFHMYVYSNERIVKDTSRGAYANLTMNCFKVQLLNPDDEIEDEYDCFEHKDYYEDENRDFGEKEQEEEKVWARQQ